jgi:hypothetical protein
MSSYETLSVPFRYIDSLEKKQHILLLYEDMAYAQMIEFRFIKNGLANGENCIYVTHEDSGSIVLKLLTHGISLQHFQSGKIKVIQLRHTCDSGQQMLDKCKRDIEFILGGLIPPYRIVGRIVPDVSTVDGMQTQLELEDKTHLCFEEFRGSIMCTYDISKMESTRRKIWMKHLRQTHHTIIHATKFGEGGVCLCQI